jgi:hypothetical protein
MAMKLQQLIRRRRAIVAEIAKQNEQLALIDAELFARMERVAVAFEGEDVDEEPQTEGRSEVARPAQADGEVLNFLTNGQRFSLQPKRTPKLEPAIVEVLREAGGGLTRNEIFERLAAKGIVVRGKDPKANLSAHLSHSSLVTHDDEKKWMLKKGA